ncbi:MAG: PilZ domain-containing protein [Oligoflexus sp.]
MGKSPRKTQELEGLDTDLREDRRRSIYLGENITCSISIKGMSHKVEIIDISPYGLAFVNRSFRVELPLKVGDQLELNFEKKEGSFSVFANITSSGLISIQNKKRQRFGVKFELQNWSTYEAFDQGLAKPLFLAKTYIRPQLTCKDSFFFNELVLFQVNGFTADGIDVVTSSRWKSIIPGQILQMDLFVPGFGLFQISCRNSRHIYRSTKLNRFRLYLEYEKKHPKLEQAICEYLLIMNNTANPRSLRQAGFQLHAIEQACHFQYPLKVLPQLNPTEFSSSICCMPDFTARTTAEQFQTRSRKIVGKIGAEELAFFRLVFFEENTQLSELQNSGFQIPAEYLMASRLEMTHLLLHANVQITDIFLAMMKHAIRIAAQSKSKYLLLDCRPMMKNVLQSIGFIAVSKKMMRIDEYGESHESIVMALEVNLRLLNRHYEIETNIWNQFYKDLGEYLGRRPPLQKTIKPYYFKA